MDVSTIIKHVKEKTSDFKCFDIKSFKPESIVIKYLIEDFGYSSLNAEELARKSTGKIIETINKTIEFYDTLGVLPPVFWIGRSNLIGTYKHAKYELPFDWEEASFLAEYIRLASPEKLLLISILYLKCSSFKKAIIVDGGNDGGIDIISKKSNGSSLIEQRVMFVQSKKCSSTLDKKILIYEDAFYKDGLVKNGGIRQMYLDKLDINKVCPSVDISYVFITNGNITNTIRDYCFRHNIRLIGAYYLSHCIMNKYTKDDAIKIIEKWSVNKRSKRGTLFDF